MEMVEARRWAKSPDNQIGLSFVCPYCGQRNLETYYFSQVTYVDSCTVAVKCCNCNDKVAVELTDDGEEAWDDEE